VTAGSLPRSYFERLYDADPDPWRFASSPYEQHKYRCTLAALSRNSYASALEVGCSVGVLTRQLAARCTALLAFDIAEAPLLEARKRCADLRWVRFARMDAPRDWPLGCFDLILLSEVVYYLDRKNVRRLAERIETSLLHGGELLLVHWIGATDYPLSGDEAVVSLLTDLEDVVTVVRRERSEKFRLDLAIRR
jgi:2-polyprenyl-3-methyl-5-hydroxy-6-metoxy-1,4-benzoquinol methylase